MRTTEERLKAIEDHFDNLSDEQIDKVFEDGHNAYELSWHPSKQNSFYTCWYCGKDGNAHLCTDGIGRGFCPECRERAEKEFLDWDNPKERENWQDE